MLKDKIEALKAQIAELKANSEEELEALGEEIQNAAELLE